MADFDSFDSSPIYELVDYDLAPPVDHRDRNAIERDEFSNVVREKWEDIRDIAGRRDDPAQFRKLAGPGLADQESGFNRPFFSLTCLSCKTRSTVEPRRARRSLSK